MRHVLIVDDNVENLYLLRTLFQGQGCEVAEARHGEEALALARRQPPDLVISDLLMPVMDGYAFLRQWKSDAALKAIPFVVYTATYTEPEDEKLALDLGADAFIVKPAEPEAFLARLNQVLIQTTAAGRPQPRVPAAPPGPLDEAHQAIVLRKLEEKAARLEQANRELAAAEDRLRRILDALPAAAYTCNAEGLITYYNQRAGELWGRAPALNDPVDRFCGSFRLSRPDGTPISHSECWMAVALRQQQTVSGEEIVIERPDGTRRQALAHASPLVDREGRLLGAVNIFVDITERRTTEEKLRESERRLRLAIEAANVGLWDWDLRTHTVWFSPEWKRQLGYQEHEVSNRFEEWQGRLHPDDADRAQARVSAYLANPWPDYENEFRLRHKDGSYRWILARASLIRDAQGTPIRMMGSHLDLTERKRIEEALRDSEELHRVTLSNISDAIFVTDDAGKLTYVSPSVDLVFGCSVAEATALGTVEALLGRECVEAARSSTQSEVQNIECQVTTKHGGRRVLLANIKRVAIRGGTTLYTCRDITARKEAEQALWRSREHLAALIRSVDGIVWEADAQTFRFTYVSPRAERLLGYPLARWTDEPAFWAEHLHPDDREAAVRYCAGCTEERRDHEFEYRMLAADGRTVWLRDIVTVIVENDQPVALRGIMVDITERKRMEEGLRRSEEMFRAVVEDQTEMIVRWKPDGTRTFVNPAYCRAMGKRYEDLVGTSLFLPEHATHREQVLRKIAALTPAKPVVTEIHEIVSPTGETLWQEWTDRGLFDATGQLVELQSTGRDITGRDITERRRAELRVQYLNRTHAVLSDINHLIVRARAPQAVLEGACRIAVAKGGFRLAWVGLTDRPSVPLRLAAHAGATPDTLAVLDRVCSDPRAGCAFTRQAMETGCHAVCNDIARDPQAAPWRQEALQRGYRAMASFPLMVAGHLAGTFNLYAAEAGFFDAEELRLLDELATDIAFALEVCEHERQRQRALEEVRASEERFRELAETIQDVFWVSDPAQGRVLYISPAYEKIWGRSCRSLYETPGSWLEAVHPDDLDRVRLAVATRLTAGTYNEEFRILRPDGQVRWIRDQTFPVRNPAGQVERVVGVARDITERRRLEEQLRQSQKLEALGTLAGGIAHDFNNILSAIIGNAELARQDLEEGHPARASIEEIRRASRRARDLVQRILTFSRPQESQLVPLQLQPVLEEAIRLLRATLPAGVQLVARIAPDLPAVRADASQIHQALLNLVTNAWHALENQTGRIEIQAEACSMDAALLESNPELTAGPAVRLSVKDTGRGMDAETLRRIFEPFFTTKPPGLGTGLGLAVVHGIVRGHGGAIRVESQPGRGSTFHLYFPASAELPAVTPAAAAAPPERPESASGRGGGEHILYLDDEEPLVFLAIRTLERLGYRVTGCTRAEEAIATFRARPQDFDLVVTDFNMPGMSGLDVARQILSIRPDAAVVMTSGYLRTGEVEAARAVGIREVILKPGTVEEMGPLVRQILQKRPRGSGAATPDTASF